uniref:Uncharacterized protein n=1 Tax=Dunaliella tertiolecta TaxID=3047 RepID=A0A7S3R0I6_DUNTE
MHTAGTYKLEVMNPQREVLYVGVVGVTAAHVSASGSTVILPEGIKAGQIGYISVELHDEFNNTISDAAPSNLAALIRHETDQDFEPVVLEPEGLACRLGMEQYRLPFNLTLAGRYDLVVRFGNDEIGSSFQGAGRQLLNNLSPLTVEPGDVKIEHTIISPTQYELQAEEEQELLLYARDQYNNIVVGASITDRVTNITISPSDVMWSAVVQNASNAAASINVRVDSPGTYTLQAYLDGMPITEPVDATILPPPSPPPSPSPSPSPSPPPFPDPVQVVPSPTPRPLPPSPSPLPGHPPPPSAPAPTPPPLEETGSGADNKDEQGGLSKEKTIIVAVVVSVIGAALLLALFWACLASKHRRELRYVQRHQDTATGKLAHVPPMVPGGWQRSTSRGMGGHGRGSTYFEGGNGKWSSPSRLTLPEVLENMREPTAQQEGLPSSYYKWLAQAKKRRSYDEEDGFSSRSRSDGQNTSPNSEQWSASSWTSPSEAAAARASIMPLPGTRHNSSCPFPPSAPAKQHFGPQQQQQQPRPSTARSDRPVSPRHLSAAMSGGSLQHPVQEDERHQSTFDVLRPPSPSSQLPSRSNSGGAIYPWMRNQTATTAHTAHMPSSNFDHHVMDPSSHKRLRSHHHNSGSSLGFLLRQPPPELFYKNSSQASLQPHHLQSMRTTHGTTFSESPRHMPRASNHAETIRQARPVPAQPWPWGQPTQPQPFREDSGSWNQHASRRASAAPQRGSLNGSRPSRYDSYPAFMYASYNNPLAE